MDQFTLYCGDGRIITGIKVSGQSWSIDYESGIKFHYHFKLGRSELVSLMIALVSPQSASVLMATNELLTLGVRSEHLPF